MNVICIYIVTKFKQIQYLDLGQRLHQPYFLKKYNNTSPASEKSSFLSRLAPSDRELPGTSPFPDAAAFAWCSQIDAASFARVPSSASTSGRPREKDFIGVEIQCVSKCKKTEFAILVFENFYECFRVGFVSSTLRPGGAGIAI